MYLLYKNEELGWGWVPLGSWLPLTEPPSSIALVLKEEAETQMGREVHRATQQVWARARAT